MAHKDRKTGYEDELSEAKWMVDGVSDAGFRLEDILTEFGKDADGILEERKPEEQTALPVPEAPKPVPEKRKRTPAAERTETPAASEKPERPITLEDVVSSTVDSVLEEQELLPERRRRGLFSRRRMADTEELYDTPRPAEQAEEEPEEIGEEPPLTEVQWAARDRMKELRRRLPFAAVLTAVSVALMVVEQQKVAVPYWSDFAAVQAVVLALLLAGTAALCYDVFVRAAQMIRRRRFTGELLVSAAAAVTLLDCVTWPLFAQRQASLPYAAVVCAALTASLWGQLCRARAVYDTCRMVSVTEEPPYLVTETPGGACKQRGRIEGFYTDLVADEAPVRWQTALVPVIFMGALVFAGLASLGRGQPQDFFLCWSVTLTASSSLALPLAWTLPWSSLARQLHKTNAAVAGWTGAERISGRRAMILTDEDLFPAGTVKINGIKLYGEEMGRAVAYAASLVKESGSGLTRLFDDLLRGENGRYLKLDNFCFYQEGGFSADYRGESLLLGTASFVRKMDVRLPGSLNLRTGIFLAVDRQLVAVFAVKYRPAESVDWAMRMLRRNRITPVLASRDPNITPALLRRKFPHGAKVQYPALTARLALSEQETGRGRPRAILLREGLLPYAETVVGSRRLCKSAREGTVFALLGSLAGMLLTGYLANLGGFALMEPLVVLVFLLLWVAPVLLLAGWAGHF